MNTTSTLNAYNTMPMTMDNNPLLPSPFVPMTTPFVPMPGFTPCLISTAPNGDMMQVVPLQAPHTVMTGDSPQFVPMPTPPLLFNPAMFPSFSPMSISVSPANLPVSMSPSPSPQPISRPPGFQQPTKTKTFLDVVNNRREISRSRSPSIGSECSDSGCEITRERCASTESVGSDSGSSKRDLVYSTLAYFERTFGPKYDNEGTRGENVLRLKVKTVIALEHIVEFISMCVKENLIESISCPVSTKKGRQHVRGYLAYIRGYNSLCTDRIEAIFNQYNESNGFPFKTLHRNPVSTL